MARKPTMSTIAEMCDVSQATVSLVLNDAPGTRISPSTRDKVLHAAQQVGYTRVRKRRARRSQTVALIINEVTSTPMIAGFVDGLSSATSDQGYLGVVINAGDDSIDEVLETLGGPDLAGVLYARLVTQEVKLPAALANVPTVCVNCWEDGSALPSVLPADYSAAMTATLSLIEAGHTRIAYVGGETTVFATRERRNGYRTALASRDIPIDPALIRPGNWSVSGGCKAMLEVLDLPDPPTAVFCFCDRTALGVYEAAARRGLRIPQDLSVIGFDDESYSATMMPPLTTMELAHGEITAKAVEILTEWVRTGEVPPHSVRVKVECPMISRRSVAAR